MIGEVDTKKYAHVCRGLWRSDGPMKKNWDCGYVFCSVRERFIFLNQFKEVKEGYSTWNAELSPCAFGFVSGHEPWDNREKSTNRKAPKQDPIFTYRTHRAGRINGCFGFDFLLFKETRTRKEFQRANQPPCILFAIFTQTSALGKLTWLLSMNGRLTDD